MVFVAAQCNVPYDVTLRDVQRIGFQVAKNVKTSLVIPCLPRLPMVSAKPLTIGLDQFKRLTVQSILDWFTDFLNSSRLVHMLD